MKDYFIGLDIGTDSVGWAVTDTEYNLCKFRGNAMWGVRLFEESNTGQERRGFREARRRLERKRQRIEWLQMLFDEEICKVDRAFFQRLKDSFLYAEDKSVSGKNTLFNDLNYNDKEHYKKYPTIYHLRKELFESDEPHDVRLVYLAVHHIIKNRGHFLFENLGINFEEARSIERLFNDLNETFKEYASNEKDYDSDSDEEEIILECNDVQHFGDILKDKSKRKTDKSKEICNLCGVTKEQKAQKTIIELMCGQSAKLSDIFGDKELDNVEKPKISFSEKFDENEAEYQSILMERYDLIEKAKAIYDWAILDEILNGKKYISAAKVKTFKEHESDLKQLKTFVREKCPEKYNEIFRESKEKLNNYTAYSGCYKANDRVILQRTNQEDFCKFLDKELKGLSQDGYEDMFVKINSGTFMPKIVVKDNGVIPMQLNRAELERILENASHYLGFLNECDDDGISVKDKIIKIFEYRIPYYVGPLNTHTDKHWLVRSKDKIYPWNFDKVVDKDKSAEEFINNLTSKCTYLPDKDVIPKNSILYSKFMVLNELNGLRIDGEKPDVKLKQDIFNNLFLKKKSVSIKALREYLKTQNCEDPDISGNDGKFSGKFTTSMQSAIDLARYDLTDEEKEDIISAITIFGDDKKLLKKRIANQFKDKLTGDEINQICKLKYSGWGRLSKELLTEIYQVDKATGEVIGDNIITTMWNTNDNFMELLGSKYKFKESIEAEVSGKLKGSWKKMVDELYVSPKVKRPIYQTLQIVQEIVKIQKCKPKKIFVEMTRSDDKKGDKGRKLSRKTQLINLYQKCIEEASKYQDEAKHLLGQIEKEENEGIFRSDRLYLYYTQLGRCMYTGKEIPIEQLFDKNIYDIDHIYPQSKVKDDSLDNRVLVLKTVNAKKDNEYPLKEEHQRNMRSLWKYLCDKELISKKKYERLVRTTELTDDELSDFIARQLVETGQSTKAVATVLKNLYGGNGDENGTEIVYVKSKIVSDFRKSTEKEDGNKYNSPNYVPQDKKEMLKCRDVNDLHHAKDAYLNIVVGNVYNERFTHNKTNFVKGLQKKWYSLNRMFNFDIESAWTATGRKSMQIVEKTMAKNNILYTRYAFKQSGGFFKQLPLKKGKGQVPLRQNGPLSNIDKYGGYDKPSSCYFSFVKYDEEQKKGGFKEIRKLIAIDNYISDEYESDRIKYLTEKKGLKNPKILIPVVKYGACIEMDGFRMHISSKSSGGIAVVYKPAMQLVLGYNWEKYVKDMGKMLEAKAKAERFNTYKFDINSFAMLTGEKNIQLYDLLIDKMKNTILNIKFSGVGNTLISGRNTFVNLSVEEQCFTLSEILKIIHANVVTGDLTKIGGAKKAGTVKTNASISEISSVKSIFLINQSPTGLFEQKINLLTYKGEAEDKEDKK